MRFGAFGLQKWCMAAGVLDASVCARGAIVLMMVNGFAFVQHCKRQSLGFREEIPNCLGECARQGVRELNLTFEVSSYQSMGRGLE